MNEAAETDRRLGRSTVLIGERGGKYPHGNSLLVEGTEESLIIDPSLSLVARRERLPHVDRVLNSHCHEDHVAGNHLFPEVEWTLHELDLPGMMSLDAMLAIYGDHPTLAYFRTALVERFHYVPRPDAVPFRAGDVFDLGGGVEVRVIHTPGHTRGHSCLHVVPDDVLYLGDIDLTSFGPYYGDAWSCLEDFEASLREVREFESRWYATFHHIGVVDGVSAFRERLDRFAAVIESRERRLLEYLVEPRTLDEIAAHRFVYRPGDPVPFADAVEHRSMVQHVERLLGAGRVHEVEAGRFMVRPA